MKGQFRHLRECYGCGTENAAALGIVNNLADDVAEARVRFSRAHQGPPGLVHGGLLATLLDEAMGTVPYDGVGIRFTADMSVRYRRPTPIETDLICRARVNETSARGFTVTATIVAAGAEDEVLVEGSATYVLAASEN